MLSLLKVWEEDIESCPIILSFATLRFKRYKLHSYLPHDNRICFSLSMGVKCCTRLPKVSINKENNRKYLIARLYAGIPMNSAKGCHKPYANKYISFKKDE